MNNLKEWCWLFIAMIMFISGMFLIGIGFGLDNLFIAIMGLYIVFAGTVPCTKAIPD